jgi:hypothetical protein
MSIQQDRKKSLTVGRFGKIQEVHWDRGAPYGTVRPIKYLGESEQ